MQEVDCYVFCLLYLYLLFLICLNVIIKQIFSLPIRPGEGVSTGYKHKEISYSFYRLVYTVDLLIRPGEGVSTG